MATKKETKNSVVRKISLTDIIGLIVGALSVGFLFLPWTTFTFKMFGEQKARTSVIGNFEGSDSLFDGSLFLGLAKIVGIIAIVLFVIYVLVKIIDFKALIPAIGKINLVRIAEVSFAVVYALVVVLTFHNFNALMDGAMKFSPFIGWYLGLICACGNLVLVFSPKTVQKLTKLKISVEK